VSRPSEALTATVGTLVAAILVLVKAYTDIDVPEGVSAALILIVSYIAAAVTWYVARKQRDPGSPVTSGPDGTVEGG
jgi:hypothetical protein